MKFFWDSTLRMIIKSERYTTTDLERLKKFRTTLKINGLNKELKALTEVWNSEVL